MPDEKKDSKSPYGQYSEDDVMNAESGNYFIQVGSDIFSHNGKMAFSRKKAEAYYDSIMEDLIAMKQHGDDTEKSDAKACLLFLKIHPMRIH